MKFKKNIFLFAVCLINLCMFGIFKISAKIINNFDNIKEKYDYLIVGSGLSGAVFANEATKNNQTCLVIDKREHIGGNVYTENIENINVHKYGAHIFHTNNKKTWDYINNFAEFNNFINSPIAVYKDEIYNLPFNMNTFSKIWNIKTPIEAREIINSQIKKSNIKTPKNLEEQAISLVGQDIYEKLVKGYTEKQWGISCKDLPSFIINRLPVRFTYNNNYFNDKYQGIPIGGYTQIINKMLENSDVLLNTNYFEFIKKFDNIYNKFDKIIYTGEIDKFYNYKFGKLDYRSLRFETEVLDTENYQGNAVVNYTDNQVPYTRIIEHKHFEFGDQPKTVITREYPEKYNFNNEPYYPVNNSKNTEIYEKYKKLSEQEKNIFFCGRLAQYKYLDMDKTIENSLNIFNKINNKII